MPTPLRLAVVGAGWAGQRQVRAARELPGVIDIVALVDRDADHLGVTAAELEVERTAAELGAILADPDVEAVSICTPHALHEPQALEAIAAGKHVLVEKPMATDVRAATRMVEAAEAAEVTLYVAEHLPYEARFAELRRIVRSGDHIGELAFAACVAGHRAPNPAYEGRRAWLADPALGGTGTWVLLGIHTVAALRFVLGEVVRVYLSDHRTGSFERPDIEATMSGVVELESGVSVWLVQTTETALKPALSGFQLYGDAGVIMANDEDYRVYVGDPGAGPPPRRLSYPAQGLSAYACELEAFAAAIKGSRGGPTDGRSERRSLAVVEAGLESARTGSPIDLRERYPEIW